MQSRGHGGSEPSRSPRAPEQQGPQAIASDKTVGPLASRRSGLQAALDEVVSALAGETPDMSAIDQPTHTDTRSERDACAEAVCDAGTLSHSEAESQWHGPACTADVAAAVIPQHAANVTMPSLRVVEQARADTVRPLQHTQSKGEPLRTREAPAAALLARSRSLRQHAAGAQTIWACLHPRQPLSARGKGETLREVRQLVRNGHVPCA